MTITNPESTHFDVIIIGGGIAGISTAYHLVLHPPKSCPNLSVCIVEARNRLGGRIHTIELSSKTVDLGANWIHGAIGNPVFDLALKHRFIDPQEHDANLPQMEEVQGKRYFVSAVTEFGQQVPHSLLEETYKSFHSFIDELDSSFGNDKKIPAIQFDNSGGKALICKIEKHLEAIDPKDHPKVSKAIFKNLLHRESCHHGAHSIEDVSLSCFSAYQELPGGNLTVHGGYYAIVHLLLDEISTITKDRNKNGQPTPSIHVKLSSPVNRISWKQPNGDVKVSCENQELIAKHVVSCLPLGVLKATSKDLFEPNLPDYKESAIQSLGFSVVDKIFLIFKEKLTSKFWDPSLNEFLLIWTDDAVDDKMKIRLKVSSPDKWWRTIYSFSRVSDHILMGWLSGKEAHHVENMDTTEVGKILTEEVFRKFFHPEFPEPENVFVTNWMEDIYSRGSYTFIGRNSSVADIDRLSQPIYSDPGQVKPILLFGGESCHPNFFSTVHGAFLSGKKAAQYLMDSNSGDDDHH